jgi:hypothetical protein
MSPVQRIADLMRADETRAAQDQQAHRFQWPRVRKGRQSQRRGRKGGEPDEVPAANRMGLRAGYRWIKSQARIPDFDTCEPLASLE